MGKTRGCSCDEGCIPSLRDVGRRDIPCNQVLGNGQGSIRVCRPDGCEDWHNAVLIHAQVGGDGQSWAWVERSKDLTNLSLRRVILQHKHTRSMQRAADICSKVVVNNPSMEQALLEMANLRP